MLHTTPLHTAAINQKGGLCYCIKRGRGQCEQAGAAALGGKDDVKTLRKSRGDVASRLTVRARPGRLSALSVSHGNSFFAK